MAGIGVVIPVFNGEKYVGEAIRSVQRQSRDDWELIVVDDGSTDDSRRLVSELAAGDPRIRLVRTGRGGVSAARNRGFAELSPACERIIFLDADDVWETHTLDVLTRALDERPAAAGAHGLGRQMDAQGRPFESLLDTLQRDRRVATETGEISWPDDWPTTFAVMAVYDCVLTGAIMFRRKALAAAGLYDPLLQYFEDWDLYLRVTLQGPLWFVPRLVLNRRMHESNASRSPVFFRGLRQVRRKVVNLLERDPDLQRVALLGQRSEHLLNLRQELQYGRTCVDQTRPLKAVFHWLRAAWHGARYLGVRANLGVQRGRKVLHPGGSLPATDNLAGWDMSCKKLPCTHPTPCS